MGALIAWSQHVEHVAEIDVAHVAHRDKVREADALRGAPVGETGQNRTRLRYRGDRPALSLPARSSHSVPASAWHSR